MKNLLAGILLLGFFSSANAAFIDSGNFTTDTTTGLDWLDLSETMGRSHQDVYYDIHDDPTYESNNVFSALDGWRYASRLEFNALAINWAGDAPWYSTLTAAPCDRVTCYDRILYPSGTFDGLISLLGGTRGYTENGIDQYGSNAETAELASDNSIASVENSEGGGWSTQDAQPLIGSFLVRVARVPETSSIYLLAFGLLGLLFGAAKRKR